MDQNQNDVPEEVLEFQKRVKGAAFGYRRSKHRGQHQRTPEPERGTFARSIRDDLHALGPRRAIVLVADQEDRKSFEKWAKRMVQDKRLKFRPQVRVTNIQKKGNITVTER